MPAYGSAEAVTRIRCCLLCVSRRSGKEVHGFWTGHAAYAAGVLTK